MFDLTVGTMAQCYDRGSICACRPVSYENNHNKMSRLLTIPQTNSYYNSDVMPNNSAILDNDMKQSNTLQSVLLGKVPAAYSHLTSHRKSPYPLSPPQSISPRSPHSPNSYLDIPLMSPCNGPPQSFQISQEMPYSMSPHRSTISSPHMPSPRPSPHTALSPHPSSSPHSSPSPASTCSTDNCQEEPIDLSCKIVKEENTPSEDKEDSGFSLLRNLLCVGKSSRERSPKTSENCDQLDNESCVGMQVTGTTPVTLAKKNMYPVGSRVSDWLVKIIQFAKSIPEFVNLSHNDKVTLILNSWTRLLLLYMSESNFQFAVTPMHSEQHSADDNEAPPPTQPTMKSVENLQGFIRKCQTMNLDQKEYAFLRMAVLFNSGYVGLDRPDLVEQLNSLIQQLLQEHAKSTRPNDVLHYSRLLLCLPALYGINCKMVENLFCKHINGNMDIDVLLKEMLQNL